MYIRDKQYPEPFAYSSGYLGEVSRGKAEGQSEGQTITNNQETSNQISNY